MKIDKTNEAIAKRLISMIAAMIPEPPEDIEIKSKEGKIISRLGDIAAAVLPPEAKQVEEILNRLVKWGVVAVETDEQIRLQVRQKLIEFAMLVAEEYSDADQK
jgi:putative heme iron utilization protein